MYFNFNLYIKISSTKELEKLNCKVLCEQEKKVGVSTKGHTEGGQSKFISTIVWITLGDWPLETHYIVR